MLRFGAYLFLLCSSEAYFPDQISVPNNFEALPSKTVCELEWDYATNTIEFDCESERWNPSKKCMHPLRPFAECLCFVTECRSIIHQLQIENDEFVRNAETSWDEKAAENIMESQVPIEDPTIWEEDPHQQNSEDGHKELGGLNAIAAIISYLVAVAAWFARIRMAILSHCSFFN